MKPGEARLLRAVYQTPDLSDLWWMDLGRCAEVDPEIFFPEKGGNVKPAKKVCSGCEVREQCLEYALKHGIRPGIWGGMSERERRRLKVTAPAASGVAA